MTNYLSSFLTSNSSAAPSQQQYAQAQPANSTWAGTFSSRIATLRKALTKDSEEDDPENEDCSHVSNVLRAYYTQKGLPLPEWLPPDPKKPQPVPQMQPQYGQYGNNTYGNNPYGNNTYGNQYGQTAHSRAQSGSGGGLSDLWDPSPAQRPAAAAATGPQSLRAQRPAPQSMRSHDGAGARKGSNEGYQTQYPQQASGTRHLPSQQVGNFQNAPVSGASRLKAKLEASGSGRNSPAANQSGQNPHGGSTYSSGPDGEAAGAPYASASQQWSATGGYDNYPQSGRHGNYGNPAYRQRPSGQR